jgi:hypothetical protein
MNIPEQAWCTREWVNGRSQIEIGRELGLTNSVVCVAIKDFCDAAGYIYDWRTNANRHYISKLALDRYIGPFEKPITHIDEHSYYHARLEHAWLLRAEGLTLEAIAKRMGSTRETVRQQIRRFGRITQKAMHRVKAKRQVVRANDQYLRDYPVDHSDEEIKAAEQIVNDQIMAEQRVAAATTPIPVIIETPYRGNIGANMAYLRRCIKDSINRGEAPFASHQMYTTVLDDGSPEERAKGIQCGYVWLELAAMQVFYTDMGWSNGMIDAWQAGMFLMKPWTVRALEGTPLPLNDWERESCRVYI